MKLLALKNVYTKVIPESIRNVFGHLRIKDRIFIVYFKSRNKKIVEKLKEKKMINVSFICMDVSFWK